jgi:tetratricopeptide (TPR) repeat protein
MGRMVASDIPELADLASAKGALAKLWRARQFHDAATLAAKAMALWPEDAEFRTQHAQSLLAAGALIEAEVAAREALLLEPESEDLWIVLADALIRRERQQESLDVLAEACRIRPDSLALQGRLGRQAQRMGEYQQAINAFTAASELEPAKEIWHLQILSALSAARRYTQAIKFAHEASLTFPESVTIQCRFAAWLRYDKRLVEAEQVARRALEIDPRASEAHATLFGILVAQRRNGEGLQMLQAACDLMPEDRSLWMLLGRHAMRRSVLDLAINAFERAVALANAPVSSWTALIEALSAKQRYEDAATEAGRALMLYSEDHSLAVLLAEARLKQGADIEALRMILAEALAQGPESILVNHPIIDALLKLGRADEAAAIMEEQQAVLDAPPKIQLRYAQALMAMGAMGQAETILTRLVAIDPDWVPGLVAFCEVLRHQKKIKDALAIFRKIEALGPDRSIMNDLRYRMFGTAE